MFVLMVSSSSLQDELRTLLWVFFFSFGGFLLVLLGVLFVVGFGFFFKRLLTFLYLFLSTSVCSSTLHPNLLCDTLHGYWALLLCSVTMKTGFTHPRWSSFHCMTSTKPLAAPAAACAPPLVTLCTSTCLLHLHSTRPSFLCIISLHQSCRHRIRINSSKSDLPQALSQVEKLLLQQSQVTQSHRQHEEFSPSKLGRPKC